MCPSSLHTQLQFSRKLPALRDRYSQRPVVTEKRKSSYVSSDLGLLGKSEYQTSLPYAVRSAEKLNLADHLTKRKAKRKQIEELVKARLPQGQPKIPLKQGQKKGKFTDSRSNGSKSKAQGLFRSSHLSSKTEMASPRIKTSIYSAPVEKVISSLSCSLDSNDDIDDNDDELDEMVSKASESPSSQELRRLQKELSSCIEKIEGVATTDKIEEGLGLDQERAGIICLARQEQAVRTFQVLYGLQEEVKELQEELDKLSSKEIKNTTEELDYLLEKTQSLRKSKKYFPRIRGQFPLSFTRGLDSSSIISPMKEKKHSVTIEKLSQEARKPVGRKFQEDERSSCSMFPMLGMTAEDSQYVDDLSSSDQSSIFKVKLASTKAKVMKKQPLTPNGSFPRRGIRTSMKSHQI